MIKRGILFFVCAGIALLPLEAQQLTRFAVVDLTKVYTQFLRDSRPVRELEERSARVQAEIDRMTAEIQELRSAQVSAEGAGDRERALRMESEINRKSNFLRQYYQVQTEELNEQRKRLSSSGTFLEQVYSEIRYIAESEGYSMVLNLKENTGILWYSPTVDITDKLITNLLTKAGR